LAELFSCHDLSRFGGIAVIALSIRSLDLQAVGKKLMDPKGKGWSEERAHKAIEDYRSYLQTQLQHPGCVGHRTPDVDEVWHEHMARTQQYQSDCEGIFGYFLEYVPWQTLDPTWTPP
jgi:hypothetical protein